MTVEKPASDDRFNAPGIRSEMTAFLRRADSLGLIDKLDERGRRLLVCYTEEGLSLKQLAKIAQEGANGNVALTNVHLLLKRRVRRMYRLMPEEAQREFENADLNRFKNEDSSKDNIRRGLSYQSKVENGSFDFGPMNFNFDAPGVRQVTKKFLLAAQEEGLLDKLDILGAAIIIAYNNIPASLEDLIPALEHTFGKKYKNFAALRSIYHIRIKWLYKNMTSKRKENLPLEDIKKLKDRPTIQGNRVKVSIPDNFKEIMLLARKETVIAIDPGTLKDTFAAPRTNLLQTVFLRNTVVMGIFQTLDTSSQQLLTNYFDYDVALNDLVDPQVTGTSRISRIRALHQQISRRLKHLHKLMPEELRLKFPVDKISALKSSTLSIRNGHYTLTERMLEQQLEKISASEPTIGTLPETAALLKTIENLGITKLLKLKDRYLLGLYFFTTASTSVIVQNMYKVNGTIESEEKLKRYILDILNEAWTFLPNALRKKLTPRALNLKSISLEQMEKMPVVSSLRGGNETTDNWYTIVSTPGALPKLIEWKVISKEDAEFWEKYYLGYKEQEPSSEQKDRLSIAVARMVANELID